MKNPEIEGYVIAGLRPNEAGASRYPYYFVTWGWSRSRRSTEVLAEATKYTTLAGAKNALRAISRELSKGYHYAILAATKSGKTFEVWPQPSNPVEQIASLDGKRP